MRILHILSQINSGKQYILINFKSVRGKKTLKKFMATHNYILMKSTVKTQAKWFKLVGEQL